jgi:hypothetical protein
VVLLVVPVVLVGIPGSCRCWARVVPVVRVVMALTASVAATAVPVVRADVPEF